MKLRKSLLLLMLPILLLAVSVNSSAQELSGEESVKGIFIPFLDPIVATPPTIPHDPNDETLDIVYSPGDLGNAEPIELTYKDLEHESQQMKAVDINKLTEVFIPLSVADTDLLNTLQSHDQREITTFMSKKQKFLGKISKLFLTFHAPIRTVNSLVQKLNEQFFRNSGVVIDANARVTSINFGIGGGIGLSDWLMKYMKKVPCFSQLPDKAGFYYALSLGLSFVKTTENGKTKLRIEPIVEYRNASRIFSPFLFGAIGFTMSHSWENRHNASWKQKASFFRLSSLNILSGEDLFGMSAAAAAVFPPGGGAAAGMEGTISRYRINADMLRVFFRNIHQFFDDKKTGDCRQMMLSLISPVD